MIHKHDFQNKIILDFEKPFVLNWNILVNWIRRVESRPPYLRDNPKSKKIAIFGSV